MGTGVVVCCLLDVPEGCSCQVNICNAPLIAGVQDVGGYICIRWKSVPLCYCSGKEAVFVGGGYLSEFVLVVFYG